MARVSRRRSPGWSSATAFSGCLPPVPRASRKSSAASDAMCLIALAWRAHPGCRLIVAANRDEYFGRATAPAAFWDDHRGVLAGRDLEAGGTWLGITLQERFAALTNYRNPSDRKTGVPSRGALVSDFLTGGATAAEYVKEVERRAMSYNGFSRLVADAASLNSTPNRGGGSARAGPGVQGLSNPLLATPWPKVGGARGWLASRLDKPFAPGPAFGLLGNTERALNGGL